MTHDEHSRLTMLLDGASGPADGATLQAPPMAIWGRAEDAIYRETTFPYDQGNPYLDALPPILTTSEAAAHLLYAPPWTPDLRSLPDHVRLHLIQDIRRFYMPLPQTLELESAVSSMIREGYRDRNPVEIGYWRKLDQRVHTMTSSGAHQPEDLAHMDTDRHWHPQRSHARGFSIVGITGAGKSSAMEMALGLYPQIIRHTSYRGQPFPTRQIVWLKLQCPYNGAIGSLCLNFFSAVDNLLETTSYTRAYTRNFHAKVAEMLPAVARVAANHGLGILVIDEIQRLSRAKSGGAKNMLDFFGELVDTIGVPVVLIGTYRAQSILQDEFLEARRSTGFGPGHWGPIEPGESWNHLMRALFRYQYVRTPIPDPVASGLGAALHEVSQGIPDFAVKAFALAQLRAVTTGREALSKELIYSAAHDGFMLARPWLDRVRMIREALARGQIDGAELTRRLANLPEVDLTELSGLIQSALATHLSRATSASLSSPPPSPPSPSGPPGEGSSKAEALGPCTSSERNGSVGVETLSASTTITAAQEGSALLTPECAAAGTPTAAAVASVPLADRANLSLNPSAVHQTANKRPSPRAHRDSGDAPNMCNISPTVGGTVSGAKAHQPAIPTKSTNGSMPFPVAKYHDHRGLVGVVARGLKQRRMPNQALREAGVIVDLFGDVPPEQIIRGLFTSSPGPE